MKAWNLVLGALVVCVLLVALSRRRADFTTHVISMPHMSRDAIRSRLETAGVRVSFVDAVEGGKVADTSMFDKKKYNFNAHQVGCALSHVRLWERLDGPALIMEDDAIPLVENLGDLVASVTKGLDLSVDIVFFGHCLESKGARYGNSENLYRSVLPRCTHAYYVTSPGLRKLVKWASTATLRLPIDEELALLCKNGYLNCLSYFPQVVRQPWQ